MGPWGFLNPSRRGRDLMDGAVRAACLSGILGGGRFARDMAAAIDDPLATHALGLVKAGDVVGLGSGRAAGAFVRALGARVRDGLRIRGVPTSEETERLAREVGIDLVGLEADIELTVDGADEVDGRLDLIRVTAARSFANGSSPRRRGGRSSWSPPTSWSRPSARAARFRSRSCRSRPRSAGGAWT